MSAQSLIVDEPAELRHEPMNPLMLIERAVDKGMDPAQLKALVDLHEQWKAARAKEAFAADMNAVQSEMPCIVRDAQNTQTKSNYIRLETLTHKAKPIYTAHGFSLSFSETESTRPNWHRITCTIRHVAGYSEQHWIDLPTDGVGPKGNAIGGMNAVQGAISTGSYGQRVLTCRVFNITIADTDLDGQRIAYDNPAPNEHAPKAPPRAARQDTPGIVDRVKAIAAAWKEAHPNAYGDDEAGKATWSADYKRWVMKVCDRVFNPQKPLEWYSLDLVTCERELGIER